MNLSAVILAAGDSRRMGVDKAWLQVAGRALIDRALATLREAGVNEIFISGRSGQDYSALGCPVLLDRQPGLGPLGGIERALASCASPLLLVLAVDLPNMPAAFLSRLAAACEGSVGVVPMLNGQLEPLAAIYPKISHRIVEDCLSAPRRAARDFAEACRGLNLVRTYSVVQPEAAFFANWNRPSDISGVGPLGAASPV